MGPPPCGVGWVVVPLPLWGGVGGGLAATEQPRRKWLNNFKNSKHAIRLVNTKLFSTSTHQQMYILSRQSPHPHPHHPPQPTGGGPPPPHTPPRPAGGDPSPMGGGGGGAPHPQGGGGGGGGGGAPPPKRLQDAPRGLSVLNRFIHTQE